MMTPEHVLRFIADVEEYYGKYTPKIRLGVLSVLHHQGTWFSADLLDRLYDALTDSFSPKWGKVPSKIEIREALETVPPAASTPMISPTTAPQVTADAGAIPGHFADAYIADIMAALRSGEIRPDGAPAVYSDGTVDSRPTATEFEQRWRERMGVA